MRTATFISPFLNLLRLLKGVQLIMRNGNSTSLPVTLSTSFRISPAYKLRPFAHLLLLIAALTIAGCEQVEPNKPSSSTAAHTGSNTAKIAITTSSDEARKEYLAG